MVECSIANKHSEMFRNGGNAVSETRPDRRVRRTQQLVLGAFTLLLEEQRYDDITVQDIIDRANIGRSTFYAHFEDKDQLLMFAFERALMTLTEPLNSREQPGTLINTVPFFEHVHSHAVSYRALVHGRGMEVLTTYGQTRVSEIIAERLVTQCAGREEATVRVPVVAHLAAGNLFLLLTWWIDRQMAYSPAQMDAIFRQFVGAGVAAALAG